MKKGNHTGRHFPADKHELALLRNVTKFVSAAFFKKRCFFLNFISKNVNVLMLFIHTLNRIWKSFFFVRLFVCLFFSKFGHLTIFAKQKFFFGCHFETKLFFRMFFFADLWLF